MSPELEDRLREIRPDLEPPSAEVVSRMRESALAALPRRNRGRRPAVLAAVFATALIGAAVALSQGVVDATLERLSSWATGTPGAPSAEQQARFNAENASSLARLPQGTAVAVLARTTYDGVTFELVGFRDGESICLRLVPDADVDPEPPACITPEEFRRAPAGVVVLGGSLRGRIPGQTTYSAVWGLAADGVETVQATLDAGQHLEAVIADNTFVAVGDPLDEGSAFGRRLRVTGPGRAVTLEVGDVGGSRTRVVLELNLPARASDADAPGPNEVERPLRGLRIGWLERGEPRGEPLHETTSQPQQPIHSRAVQPASATSLVVGLTAARGTSRETAGRWYCISWIYPLRATPRGESCSRVGADSEPVLYAGEWSPVGQYPTMIGIADDEVASLRLYLADGTQRAVPIVDNAFTFQINRSERVTLVGYDDARRIVYTEPVPGPGMVGVAISP